MISKFDRGAEQARPLAAWRVLGAVCVVTLTVGLPATVPAAVAATPFFEVGFLNNTGTLSLVGMVNNGASGFTIMPGTSPSLTRLSNGGYEVAFQNTTGSLITWGPDGVLNWEQRRQAPARASPPCRRENTRWRTSALTAS